MKTVKYLLLSFLISLSFVLFYSCDKDPQEEEQTLPPITTEGLNTFGCLVNGEVWVPERENDVRCNYYPRFEFLDERLWGTFYCIGSNKEGKIRSIILTHNEIFSEDIFTLTYTGNPGTISFKGGGATVNVDQLQNEHKTLNVLSDQLHIIKLDTINNIVSGTFEFDAINKYEPHDTIKVREGRFDIEFRY